MFDMEICWNGRQYTVVRSLHRLRQLREELIAELEMLQVSKNTAAAVPELPSLPENGGSNQSFTLLQGLLRSHVPAMEAWLQKVFWLVPNVNDCATLTNFILEPICSLHSPVELLTLSESLPSLLRRSSLTSIEESYEDDDEFDDDNDSTDY